MSQNICFCHFPLQAKSKPRQVPSAPHVTGLMPMAITPAAPQTALEAAALSASNSVREQVRAMAGKTRPSGEACKGSCAIGASGTRRQNLWDSFSVSRRQIHVSMLMRRKGMPFDCQQRQMLTACRLKTNASIGHSQTVQCQSSQGV